MEAKKVEASSTMKAMKAKSVAAAAPAMRTMKAKRLAGAEREDPPQVEGGATPQGILRPSGRMRIVHLRCACTGYALFSVRCKTLGLE